MATTYTDTTVNNLVINKMTKDEYDALVNKSDTEIYLVEDEVDTTPTSGSDNYITSGGVYTALQDKADKVSSATSGNFAGLDSNGNLTDSGSKASDFLTQHQDISGKANKSEMSVVDGTDSDADKTTITLKTGTSATVLKSHQDISGKQDVINSSNKLSADYIVDGTTNKVINVKPDWNAASGSAAEILNKPTIPSVPVTDVTVDGTSVVSNGTAAIPYIPDPPGFLRTNNATAQTVVDNESMAGNIKLHKIAKTGTYSDLIGTPSIPDAVSGTNDGTNWTTITIGSTTKAIPSGGGGSSTLSGLTDTNISNPSAGQTLKYNNSSSKWENSDFPTEIPPQTSNSGKFLTTNGSAVSWADAPTELPSITGNASKILAVNSGATGVEWTTITPGSTTLSGLTDTTITNPADKQVLTYDNTTSKWVNANAEKEIFWCVMTETNGSWSCDKTSSEIYAAYQAGKLVCLKNDNSIYSPAYILWDSSDDDLVAAFAMDTFVNKSVISGGQQTGTSYFGAGFYHQNGTWSYDGTMLNNIDVLELIPDSLGTAGQAIVVNSGADGLEFATVSGGLTNYDFTHTANTTVSGSVTVTYAANTRGSRMVSASADLSVTFAVNNSSDNYLWIKNTGSSDIDILISSVTYNNSSVSNVYMPDDGISIPAGKVCEIGIVCNADGAFITSRSDLSL